LGSQARENWLATNANKGIDKIFLRRRVNMVIRNKIIFLFLGMIAAGAFATKPAHAHSFRVMLFIPQSQAAALEVRQGFMLAATERDGHPEQGADGHLGGLDVYVSVIDGRGDVFAMFGRIARKGEFDIIAVFGSEATLDLIENLIDGTQVAVLRPGNANFSGPRQLAVAAFTAAYQKVYSTKPSSLAFEGYNAARRIDAAVRAQDGVADKALLLKNFKETAHRFAG